MRNTLCWGLASLAALAVSLSAAQGGGTSIWQPAQLSVDAQSNPFAGWIAKYQTFRVDPSELRTTLGRAPLQQVGRFDRYSIIDLPMPDGTVRAYRICESPIMSDALAQRISVKTYRVQSVDNPAENGRLDLGPNGFHAFVRSTNGETFVVEPVKRGDQSGVFSYFRRDNLQPKSFICYTQNGVTGRTTFPGLGGRGGVSILSAGDTIKSYRLAMNATGEYTAFFGGDTQANAALVTSVNRQNSVYEIDFAIHLNLIYQKCWPDPNTDPYTNDNGGAMLSENQTETDNTVGDANYDMGHVFSTGGGGVASLNSVGVTGRKAMGVTGLPAPVGDDFDIDFVAHEMGHQFGGRHTFNGTDGNCGGAHDDPAAYEPGSGTTIMAYAGICASEDVQPHSDPYFHIDSLERITSWRNDPQSGGTETPTGNRQPTANAGGDFTIPQLTPFKLTGAGTDADNDPITYCWEQFDLGTPTPTNDNTTRPLFRSFNPTTDTSRVFPKMADIIGGVSNPYEFLPDVDRSMKFRVTVRDNHAGSGGYAFDEMQVTVTGAPFQALEPSTAASWQGNSTQTVTWNPGGSSSANVNIYLSVDGGADYVKNQSILVLANTPNDGSQTITAPNVDTTNGRIIVEGAGNIFFDVADGVLTLQSVATNPPVISSINPTSAIAGSPGFTLTVNGDHFEMSSKVRWFGADRPTTYISTNEIRATISASDIVFAQSIPITVRTPVAGTSNTVNFQINNPVPTFASMTPSSIASGSASFTLTVTGTNFVSGSRVTWNGLIRNTVFISSTKISATILSSDVSSVGTAQVRVMTPGPGGGTTAAKSFQVVQIAPTSISIVPNRVIGGTSASAIAYLNNAAPGGGQVITLSKVGSAISLPASTNVAAGKYGGKFTVSTTPVASDSVCTVRATANGVTVSQTITVLAPAPTSVTLNPSSIIGGQGSTGTFTLSGPAPAPGILVTISAGGSGLVSAGSPVWVPGGQTSKSFNITTKKVLWPTNVAIRATYNGKVATGVLTLNP